VLLGFLALYFVDVAGLPVTAAGSAVALWVGTGLAGNVVLIPLLERVPGLLYLRRSVALTLLLYPAFLLVPWVGAKLLLVAVMGFCNAGWYAVLKGKLYASLPGRSGTVVAVASATGVVGGLIPAFLGLIAQQFGLAAMMGLLVIGPVLLLLALPSRSATL
jgi:FSR family fosmidomycin resistance protein-like MFS transporter